MGVPRKTSQGYSNRISRKVKLNIIYDNRRTEKYDLLIAELDRQGISDYEIFPCIIRNDVIESINASHKMLIQKAKDEGEEMICVAEDDLWFPADDGWQYFLKNKPGKFDLYLGGSYVIDDCFPQICGFHLYICHEKFYDRFLSVPNNKHIDTEINNLKGDFHFCRPFPALQRPGFSANNKCVVNYNGILKEGDVYVGK